MSDRAVPAAALVALVLVGGAVAGALLAAVLTAGDDDTPDDSDVIAAIATRSDVDRDTAGCALGRLVAGDVLDDELRRRLVDATDGLDDVPVLDEVVAACGAPPTTAPGDPLEACLAGAGDDTAGAEVCAVDALVRVLTQGEDLDVPTASCAAAAVVDELGVEPVLAALQGGPLPDDVRARIQSAFAACS